MHKKETHLGDVRLAAIIDACTFGAAGVSWSVADETSICIVAKEICIQPNSQFRQELSVRLRRYLMARCIRERRPPGKFPHISAR